MKVEDFVKKYKATPKLVDLKKHVVNKYVPYLEKIALCTNIVNSTSHIETKDKRQLVKINTPARYVLFTMYILNTYTDLDVDFTEDNFVKDYDMLKEAGLIEAFLDIDKNTGKSLIPLSEYVEFNTVLNMALDDLRDNEYSLTAMAYNFKESLHISEDILNEVIKEIEKKISK